MGELLLLWALCGRHCAVQEYAAELYCKELLTGSFGLRDVPQGGLRIRLLGLPEDLLAGMARRNLLGFR